jgi:endonuclease/exonuclease/phosphatase family protein
MLTNAPGSIKLVCQLFRVVAIAFLISIFGGHEGFAQTLTVVSWNVESGGSDDQTIRQRIGSFQGVDVWGLSEVNNATSASTFELGAEDGEDANFERIVGTTGGADRLTILYNADRFRLIRSEELTDIGSGNHRAPLVAELQEIATNKSFLFMVNHLARGNNTLRHQQATKLNEWVRTQTLPVIAVGDYNFDWEVVGGDQDHDTGYDNMTAANVWTWVRPASLIKSQCSPNFNSVLDFIFVNSGAQSWSGSSQIIVEPNDCDASPLTSDHRPLVGTFNISAGPLTKEQLLRKIEEIERQLTQLKDAVRLLP